MADKDSHHRQPPRLSLSSGYRSLVRPKIRIENGLVAERALCRQDFLRQPGFGSCLTGSVVTNTSAPLEVFAIWAQAWSRVEASVDTASLIPNADFRTGPASARLHLPLHQVRKERGHPIHQLALFALAQVFDMKSRSRDERDIWISSYYGSARPFLST